MNRNVLVVQELMSVSIFVGEGWVEVMVATRCVLSSETQCE